MRDSLESHMSDAAMEQAEEIMISETQKTTLVIVDDDAAIRDSLSSFLEASGFSAQTFSSAEEFLQKFDFEFNARHLSCLLLDLRLPGMDGLELQRHLVGRGIHIPTIILTAHGDIPTVSSSFRLGVVDFIQKPFRTDDLLARIREAVAKHADHTDWSDEDE